MTPALQHADIRLLKSEIDWHLAHLQDDDVLLARLEGLARHADFSALTWYWAPWLYRRDPEHFRRFVLQHFADVAPGAGGALEPLPWSGEVAAALEPWFDEIDQADDLPLFHRLYVWRHRRPGGGVDAAAWRRDLLSRFLAAETPAQRAAVLAKFDLRLPLDEPTAQALYAHDPEQARAFIVKKLPWPRRDLPTPCWTALMQQALDRGDRDLHDALYRRMAPLDRWERDALALCRGPADAAALNAALERLHPEGRRQDLGEVVAAVMQARGLEVLPYVRAHLREVFSYWGRQGYGTLEQLARTRDWTEFRIALVVTCGQPQAYNAALAETLDDRALADEERRHRLALLAGASPEWQAAGWGPARDHPLDSALALRLYERHPDLVRTVFMARIVPTWRDTHAARFERAGAAGDTELSDHLASRYATRGAWSDPKEVEAFDPVVDRATELMFALKLPAPRLARRAAAILTRIPAQSIRNDQALMRHNRLARLLFGCAPSSFLADPAGVRDLVDGADVHVQRLACRVLALPQAQALAREHLDRLMLHLQDRPPRDTFMQALRALDNAATDDTAVQRVLARAREALAQPDARGSNEALVGLVGRLVARYPALASASESRVVYRRP